MLAGREEYRIRRVGRSETAMSHETLAHPCASSEWLANLTGSNLDIQRMAPEGRGQGKPEQRARRVRLADIYSISGVREIRIRRVVRVVEGARLESVYTATYRGFESLTLRH